MPLSQISIYQLLAKCEPALHLQIRQWWLDEGVQYLVLCTNEARGTVRVLPVGPQLEFKDLALMPNVNVGGHRARDFVRCKNAPKSGSGNTAIFGLLEKFQQGIRPAPPLPATLAKTPEVRPAQPPHPVLPVAPEPAVAAGLEPPAVEVGTDLRALLDQIERERQRLAANREEIRALHDRILQRGAALAAEDLAEGTGEGEDTAPNLTRFQVPAPASAVPPAVSR